jgi:tRNA(fMet)-specific endonuclease VapC
MNLYILDKDTLSLSQQGHAAINARVSTLAPGELAITVLSVEEQILGRFTQVRKARNADELVEAYQHLTETIQMLSGAAILSFTKPAVTRFTQLLRLKLGVGKMDLRIAAVALENNGVVVTRNLRDFKRIPNLVVENWAV